MDEVISYVDTRAAEVATTAIASDVAQVHQDMLDADADASAAAASAAAAAGTLANAVKKTGEASQSIAGDIAVAGTLSGSVVTGTTVTVPTPVNNTDATTKKYVDDQNALDAKLAGATFTGQVNASGQRAYAPGNTTDVATIGTLDAYTPMVRTTGTQAITGRKDFTGGALGICLDVKSTNIDVTETVGTPSSGAMLRFVDKNDVEIIGLFAVKFVDDTFGLSYRIRKSDGTYSYTSLIRGT